MLCDHFHAEKKLYRLVSLSFALQHAASGATDIGALVIADDVTILKCSSLRLSAFMSELEFMTLS